METLHLNKPLLINGKERTTLTYDAEEITPEAYARADFLSSKFATKTGKAVVQEFNYGFHLYLGFEAILAVNKDIDIMDLQRVKGYDVQKIAEIGRSFLLQLKGESDKKTLDEQSEIMPESTKQTSGE